MKFFLLTLLLTLPAWALGNPDQNLQQNEVTSAAEAGTEQSETLDSSITWVDDSHAYATDRAQDLTKWMDSFFGDPNYDLEKPESLLRLEWANKWDEHEDYKNRIRLRGKLRLPLLSKRLNLVFSGEDGDTITEDGQKSGDRAALLYEIGEDKRQRLDLTMGIDWGGLKPGIRYRNQGAITDKWGYRYTQRIQWEDDEGFFTTSQLNLDHLLDEDTLLRWGSRVIYGEETEGTEWRTGLSLRRKWLAKKNQDPYVLSYFGSVEGITDPSYIKNYRLGVLFRRQFFRRYFFVELEPSYNFRKTDEDENRKEAWNVILRLEIVFETKRRRTEQTLAQKQNGLRIETKSKSSTVSFPVPDVSPSNEVFNQATVDTPDQSESRAPSKL
jgi:hypothetical protein